MARLPASAGLLAVFALIPAVHAFGSVPETDPLAAQHSACYAEGYNGFTDSKGDSCSDRGRANGGFGYRMCGAPQTLFDRDLSDEDGQATLDNCPACCAWNNEIEALKADYKHATPTCNWWPRRSSAELQAQYNLPECSIGDRASTIEKTYSVGNPPTKGNNLSEGYRLADRYVTASGGYQWTTTFGCTDETPDDDCNKVYRVESRPDYAQMGDATMFHENYGTEVGVTFSNMCECVLEAESDHCGNDTRLIDWAAGRPEDPTDEDLNDGHSRTLPGGSLHNRGNPEGDYSVSLDGKKYQPCMYDGEVVYEHTFADPDGPAPHSYAGYNYYGASSSHVYYQYIKLSYSHNTPWAETVLTTWSIPEVPAQPDSKYYEGYEDIPVEGNGLGTTRMGEVWDGTEDKEMPNIYVNSKHEDGKNRFVFASDFHPWCPLMFQPNTWYQEGLLESTLTSAPAGQAWFVPACPVEMIEHVKAHYAPPDGWSY